MEHDFKTLHILKQAMVVLKIFGVKKPGGNITYENNRLYIFFCNREDAATIFYDYDQVFSAVDTEGTNKLMNFKPDPDWQIQLGQIYEKAKVKNNETKEIGEKI